MAARGDDDVGRLGGSEFLEGLVELASDDLDGVGKALGVGVGFAIVGDDALEARIARGLEELEGHVAAAEDVKQR